MKNKITSFIRKLTGTESLTERINQLEEHCVYDIGQLKIAPLKQKKRVHSLREVECKVHSQVGDDGIIQWLINNIEIPNQEFLEFGVQNYKESNTRFLLKHDNWRGVVIDGNRKFIDYIKNDALYWKHDLKAIYSFITKKNINDLIQQNFALQDIGLLSIDIDGNDYWIWKEITSIKPRIVICEFNSLWGMVEEVTIPYQESFERSNAHYSHLYFGASLQALKCLGERKGYRFIGTNSSGINAFFVREDLAEGLLAKIDNITASPSRHRESRNESGRLTYLDRDASLQLLKDLPLFDLKSQEKKKVREIFNL